MKKLSEGLVNKLKTLTWNMKRNGANPKEGLQLLKAALVYYIFFNRKRGGNYKRFFLNLIPTRCCHVILRFKNESRFKKDC